MVFPSAVDRWFLALIAALVLLFGWILVGGWLSGRPPGVVDVLVGGGVGVGLPIWLLLSTDYRITEQALVVRAGPFRWRIERASIERVRASRSPIASPALSLDRLAIDHGGGRTLRVSPKDRAGFLRALGISGGTSAAD